MSVHIASGTQDSSGTAHVRLYISSEWLRSGTFSSSATTVSVQFDAQDGSSICSTAVSWTPASLVACPAGVSSAAVPAMCALIACDSTGALSGATGAVSAKYSVCAAADSACRNVRYSVVGSVTSGGGGSGGDDSSGGGSGSGGPASPATTTSSANNPKTSNSGAAAATDSGASASGGGTSPAVYVAIVAVVLLLVGGAVWWYRKRSASKQDYMDSQPPSRVRSFHYDASADLTPPVSFQSDTRNQQQSRTPKPLPIPGSLSHQQQNNQTIHPDLSHAAMYNPSALNRELRDMNNNNKPPPPVSKDYELAELKKAEPRFPESRPFQGAAVSRLAEESAAQRTNSIQGSIHSVEPVIEREGAAATVRTVQYASTPSPETAVIANASPVIDPAAIVSKYRMDDVSSFSGSSAPLPPPPTIQAAVNRFDPESSLSQLQSSVNGLPVATASAASVQGPRQQPQQSSRPVRQEQREVPPPVGLDALMQTDLPPSYNQQQQQRSQGATPVVVAAAAETLQQQQRSVQNAVPVGMAPQGVYTSGISGMPQQQPVGGVYAAPAFVGNGGYTPSPAAAAYAAYNPYAGYAVPANGSAGYAANGNVGYPPMNGNFAMYPPPQQQQQQQQAPPAGFTSSPPPQQQGGYPGYYDHLGNYHYYENERRG
ncbi:hypothetical protein BJ741DRAFT_622214 [Chytriomyces cf. hyalinus JEL632]|nr:hypothetical protein BJ741DRAFT_622214 [Chytriomyces cf. hyalinus JEL632]